MKPRAPDSSDADAGGLLSGRPVDEDLSFDSTLRPTSLHDYVGQEQVKANLRVAIEAARGRGENCAALPDR